METFSITDTGALRGIFRLEPTGMMVKFSLCAGAAPKWGKSLPHRGQFGSGKQKGEHDPPPSPS